MTQFTASEVRAWFEGMVEQGLVDELTLQYGLAFAGLLEAREKALPIGWVFQHEETGRMTFCENDGGNNAENFAANNPRHVLCGPAFTHPAPSGAEKRETMTPRELAKRIERGEKWKLADEPTPCQSRDAGRLAEALRRTCRKMKTFSRTGALDGAVAVWVDEIESVLAVHSAQAQPPAASVTDGYVIAKSDPDSSMIHAGMEWYQRNAEGQDLAVMIVCMWHAMLAAQENPNG